MANASCSKCYVRRATVTAVRRHRWRWQLKLPAGGKTRENEKRERVAVQVTPIYVLVLSIVFSSPLDAFSYIVKEQSEFPMEVALQIKVGQCRRKARRTQRVLPQLSS